MKMLRSTRFGLIVPSVLAMLLVTAVPSVYAETISLEFGCTLNNAIRSPQTDTSVGGCRAGDPGRDILFVVDTVTIVEDPVTITEDMSFVGDRETSTLDGQGRFSFFYVAEDVTVNLQDFFMTNGYGTRDSGQTRLESGARILLNEVHINNCKGVKEIVAPDDAHVGLGHNASVCGKMAPFNPHPPIIEPPTEPDPTPTKRPTTKSDSPSKSGRGKTVIKVKAPVMPPAYTCEHLPATIVVYANAGTRSGIQCQEIDATGVGIQSVIEAGIIGAVDVWGYVAPGVQVCLQGSGSLIFLDAAGAPRQPSWIPSFEDASWTCAEFDRAGSLVLVGSGPQQKRPTSANASLSNCQIRALDILNIRETPGGSVVGHLPWDASLQATDRTGDWFKIHYAGIDGWISADYVETSGSCKLPVS